MRQLPDDVLRKLRNGGRLLASPLYRRALHPRYAALPADWFMRPLRVLDAGAGPSDAALAKTLLAPGTWFEAINIVPRPAGTEGAAFDAYHVRDLDKTDLDFVEDGSFDYVVCSHTIEHLEDGVAVLNRLCAKVRPGGRLYLEWPSMESLSFPIRGLGLNFYDDPTHRATYPLALVADIVEKAGFEVVYAGKRHVWLRMISSPFLTFYHSLKARRLRLYDLWDWTGFAYVVTALRPLSQGPGDRAG